IAPRQPPPPADRPPQPAARRLRCRRRTDPPHRRARAARERRVRRGGLLRRGGGWGPGFSCRNNAARPRLFRLTGGKVSAVTMGELAPQRSMRHDQVLMSVWSKIVELAARAFDPEAEPPALNEQCAPQPNDVGFTAAVIGLAAKMAKADGEATESEL